MLATLAVTSQHHPSVRNIAKVITCIRYNMYPCLHAENAMHLTKFHGVRDRKEILDSGFWVYAMLCYCDLMRHDLLDSFIS